MAHIYRNERLEFLRALATALGRDPDSDPITGITLVCNINDVVKVEVRSLLPVESLGRVAELMKRYRLYEVEDSPDAGRTALPTG